MIGTDKSVELNLLERMGQLLGEMLAQQLQALLVLSKSLQLVLLLLSIHTEIPVLA